MTPPPPAPGGGDFFKRDTQKHLPKTFQRFTLPQPLARTPGGGGPVRHGPLQPWPGEAESKRSPPPTQPTVIKCRKPPGPQGPHHVPRQHVAAALHVARERPPRPSARAGRQTDGVGPIPTSSSPHRGKRPLNKTAGMRLGGGGLRGGSPA